MKRIFLTLTLLTAGLSQVMALGRSDLTIANNDNQRYELHGTENGTTWKFYINPKETISELVPIPADAHALALAGQNPVAIGDTKYFVIENGTLKPARLEARASQADEDYTEPVGADSDKGADSDSDF